MWRSFKNANTRPLGRVSRYFWKNHSEKRLRFFIRVISGREMSGRLKGQTYMWRTLRKRLVYHYTKNYGAVPAFFLQEHLQSKISASSDWVEYRAWAYQHMPNPSFKRDA